MTDKIHLFGRYSYFHDQLNGNPIWGSVMGGAGPSGLGNPAVAHDHNIAVGFDDALTDSFLTDLRLGYLPVARRSMPKYDKGVNLATNLGIPGLNGTGYALTDGAPSFSVSGTGSAGALAFGNNCNCQLFEDEEQFQIVNNWTKTLKTHTIRWGADLRYGRNLRVSQRSPTVPVALTFGIGPTSNRTRDWRGGIRDLHAGKRNSVWPVREQDQQRQGNPEAHLLLRSRFVARNSQTHCSIWACVGRSTSLRQSMLPETARS